MCIYLRIYVYAHAHTHTHACSPCKKTPRQDGGQRTHGGTMMPARGPDKGCGL